MTDNARQERKLTRLRRFVRVVTVLAWTVAIGVMAYGMPIVYRYLTHHDVPKQTAWILSLAVDGALAVGLVATPLLAEHGIKAGWVGILRWFAGFATWALNTADSWSKPSGPDLGGVISHTWGPLAMFFVVEAAAYFQRKMADVVAEYEDKLAAAETKVRTEAKELGDLRAKVRTLTAEVSEARTATAKATADAAATAREWEAKVAAARAEGEAEAERIRMEADAEVGILRQRTTTAEAKAAQLAEALEAATTDHRAALARVRAEAAEKIALARAEATVPRLSDRRTGGSGGATKTARKTTAARGNQPVLSDEDAVQKCIAEHPESNFEWSQAEIVKIVGCGWGRAPRLLDAIAAYHRGAASGSASEAASG
ncbi:hypothetical protein ABZ949_02150 [Micromonospora tulbaghiae]|uniref:hypothetical protein n=1 Tax=Micromonospora tulbaghiae TaxID=479978 RepID=UPI0033F7396C